MFATTDLSFATFLRATGLKFQGCRVVSASLVEFIFDDPSNKAPELERDFYAGAVASAYDVLESLRHLRRAATRELSRNGGSDVTR